LGNLVGNDDGVMPRVDVFLCVLALGEALSIESAAAGIAISPAQPTAQDSVKAIVQSGFPALCWHDVGQTCSMDQPDTLSVTVDVDYCNGGPPCNCGQFPHGYQRSCNFGTLPAGSYVARFTELHRNPDDPIHTFTQSLRFTVGASTPTLRRTWGKLKAHYR